MFIAQKRQWAEPRQANLAPQSDKVADKAKGQRQALQVADTPKGHELNGCACAVAVHGPEQQASSPTAGALAGRGGGARARVQARSEIRKKIVCEI